MFLKELIDYFGLLCKISWLLDTTMKTNVLVHDGITSYSQKSKT